METPALQQAGAGALRPTYFSLPSDEDVYSEGRPPRPPGWPGVRAVMALMHLRYEVPVTDEVLAEQVG